MIQEQLAADLLRLGRMALVAVLDEQRADFFSKNSTPASSARSSVLAQCERHHP